jgi:hypothetical protein
MKCIISILALTIIASSAVAQLTPKFRYLADAAALTAGESVKGPSRVIDLKGRKGINPQSIHTVIKLGGHNLNDAKGTVVLWFFALEDLGASFLADHMKMDNPHFATYAFLSDFETPRDVAEANFSFEWNRFNELRAKFFKGTGAPPRPLRPTNGTRHRSSSRMAKSGPPSTARYCLRLTTAPAPIPARSSTAATSRCVAWSTRRWSFGT